MFRDFCRSLGIQKHVVGALIMRELYTRFGRENLGFLWIVGEPLMFCVGVSVMWSAIHSAEHGIGIVAFVITGYNPLTLWRHCVNRSLKAFESNGSLLFHRQVTTLDIITARLCTEFYGSTVSFILTAGGAMMLGLMKPPQDIGLVYMGWFFVMFFSASCALLFAGLSEMNEVLEKVMPVTTYLAIPLSGAFVMVDWVPANFQKYLLLSPSVNAVEMIRGGLFGPTCRPHYDMVFTAWTSALLLLAGIYAVRKARAYVLVV